MEHHRLGYGQHSYASSLLAPGGQIISSMDKLNARGAFLSQTLAFQAPEVASKLPTVDLYAADVWAVGVTLFFCVCGRLPIQENSLMQTLLKVKSGDIAIPDTIQGATRDMLSALLERNAAARPSAKEALGHAWFEPRDDVRRRRN
mmetsp:Transcript_15912/g.65105  ORF Transcript_15912/g.65105 Transcript_15912/m.65105 type:complete len:146 (-) Transcript_15912:1641-2078(-)